MQNAGSRFQKRFADEMLLERLRILPTDDMVDLEVRQKCNQLYRGWAQTYKDTPGMTSIATLYKQLPKKQRPVASQSKVIRETEREAQENPFGTEEELVAAPTSHAVSAMPSTPPPGSRRGSVAGPSTPTSSSSPAAGHSRTPSKSQTQADPEHISGGGIWGHHSRKSKHKQNSSTSSQKGQQPKIFSLEKEKPAMLSAIAQSSIASTNLLNSMRHLNRETSRVSEDTECLKRFETCKALRRQILRYIQLVESEQWIGSLLNANDELVKALIAFEVADKSVDDDSDSDNETEMVNHEGRGLVLRPKEGQHYGEDDNAPPQHNHYGGGGVSKRESLAPPSAPQSRRTSLADKGAAPPPPKPPRPSQLPTSVDATLQQQRRHVSQHHHHHQQPPQPTPISEGNEDDPFGDRNAF